MATPVNAAEYGIDINQLGMIAQRMLYWHTPYANGNLARSIGDLDGDTPSSVSFIMFNKNQSAPYGALLNEAKTIKYRAIDRRTRKPYYIEHVNRHYGWVDRFADNFAIELALRTGAVRVL